MRLYSDTADNVPPPKEKPTEEAKSAPEVIAPTDGTEQVVFQAPPSTKSNEKSKVEAEHPKDEL